MEIKIVESVDALTNLHEARTRRRKEVDGLVVLRAERSIDLPAQTISQSEIRLDLPIVLPIEANRILIDVALRVAKIAAREIGLGQEQFGNRVGHPVVFCPLGKKS